MADTYTKAFFHLVFAVKNRQALIDRSWKNDLEKYITGIIQNNNHKLIAIGTMPVHVHILIGYNLNQTIPDLVEEIKTSSNHWIKKNNLTKFNFNWQKGYGAFTFSHLQLDGIAKYVRNQADHHRNRTFREEYIDMLNNFKINYKEKYIFEFFDKMKGWE